MAQAQAQLLRLPRLEDVVVHASALDGGKEQLAIGIGGEQHAARQRPALLDEREELDAGDRLHALIADDDADLLFLQDPDRLRSGSGGQH